MAHSDKRFKQLFLALATIILLIPLFGNLVTNSFFGRAQQSVRAAKKANGFDVNKVVKAKVVYAKHVPILEVTIKPSVTNAFAKKDQLKFAFDKKNVDLKNMKASVEKNLPFKPTTKKDVTLLLTFNKGVKSGTYRQAYAIPTKKVSKIKATYRGQKIKVTNNQIKSGKYAQKQADTASKKEQRHFKHQVTTKRSTKTATKAQTTTSQSSTASADTESSAVVSSANNTGQQTESQTATYAETYGDTVGNNVTASGTTGYAAANAGSVTGSSTTGTGYQSQGASSTSNANQNVNSGRNGNQSSTYRSGASSSAPSQPTTYSRSASSTASSNYQHDYKSVTRNHLTKLFVDG